MKSQAVRNEVTRILADRGCRLAICLGSLGFLCAMLLRVHIIVSTVEMDSWIDLEIYRATGALVSHGLNPFDPQDGWEFRDSLRIGMSRFNPSLGTKWRFDYYVQGNLPFNLWLFGEIDSVSSRPLWYRLAFATCDSLACALVLVFVVMRWSLGPPVRLDQAPVFPSLSSLLYVALWALVLLGGTLAWGANRRDTTTMWLVLCVQVGCGLLLWLLLARSVRRFVRRNPTRAVAGLLLGPFSPLFLLWGTYYSEDKGIEILFLVATLLCLNSSVRWARIYASAVCLGLSVAFKGLGVFLIPPAVVRAIGPEHRLRDGTIFLSLAGLFALVWHVPFLPQVLEMMASRLSAGSTAVPIHSSVWVWVAMYTDQWSLLRWVFVGVFLSLGVFGYWRRRLPLEAVAGVILLVFVVLVLTGGAATRMNMALIMGVLLLGVGSSGSALFLALGYVLLGGVMWLLPKNFPLVNSALFSGFALLFGLVLFARSVFGTSEQPSEADGPSMLQSTLS